MKIIDFKTVSPLFEMERDGLKPFTTRRYDGEEGEVSGLYCRDCAEKYKKELGAWEVGSH